MHRYGFIVFLFFSITLVSSVSAASDNLLLRWQFASPTGEIEANAVDSLHRARLLPGDYNRPLPERVPEGVHGEEAGAVRLTEDSRIALLEPLELPESWTLSFWIQDQRSGRELPQQLSPADIVTIEKQLLALDRTWYFRTDPDDEGQANNWHRGADDGWKEIQVPAFWSATHVGGSYYGYGWYKTDFYVPEEAAAIKHELHFGGVDEQAWVYINGRLVGEQSTESTGKTAGDIWDEPFSVTVPPEILRPGTDNRLVVRTHAHTGQAGIFRPVSFRLPEEYRSTMNLAELYSERPSPGQWEHIAVTVAPDQTRLYFNGNPAAATERPMWDRPATRVTMTFTQRGRTAFTGLLDDVRIYSLTLNPDQVAGLAGEIYHPEAGWLSRYCDDMQRLIHAGTFSLDRTEYMVELGAPDQDRLIEVSRFSEEPQKQLDALWALGVLGGYEGLERLIAGLDDDNQEIVHTVNEALLRLHEEANFISLLEDQGDTAAVDLLQQILLQARDEELQFAALSALGSLGSEAALQVLATAVEAGGWRIQRYAAQVLHEQGEETDLSLIDELRGWPMWRYDPARSADSPHQLSEELHLHWVRELEPPQRAWPHQWDDRGKLDFDVSYAPVAAGGLVFVPSNVTDSVTAYSLEDGRRVWRYHADGPVRLAPAFYRGRLYFSSDDGRFYCLDAKTGEPVWKFQAAPTDQRLLGNERIISFWPARTGPAAVDGTVYFTAGIWPLHGIFIYALDAETGTVQWVNDTTSSDYVSLPHGGAEGFGGLVPQGYIAVSGDRLIVAGGRTPPAFFNRHTGVFEQADFRPAKGAGSYAVHGIDGGGMGRRRNSLLRDRVASLADRIEGRVFYQLAADDRLVVVTEDGRLYCFGADPVEPVSHSYSPVPLEPGSEAWSSVARQALQRLGESEGYALVLGAGSGDLLRELLHQSEMHVTVAERDPRRVQALREELIGAGMYGRRAAVIEADPVGFAVQPYLFSLVLSEDAAGFGDNPAAVAYVLDRLRPYGGVAGLGRVEASSTAITQALATSKVEKIDFEVSDGNLLARRGGPLPGAGQWTHQLSDPTNNLLSRDRRVRLPVGVLWFGGPSNHDILPRHSGGPRPQVAAGRQVYLGVENIAARCVYTGRRLWYREFPGIGHPFTNLELEERWQRGQEVYMTNIPGATYIGSPFVTLPDVIYLRYAGVIHRLDPVTGETVSELNAPGRPVAEIYANEELPDWGHLSVQGDYLITTGEPHIFEDQELGWTESYSGTSSRVIAVFDRDSEEMLWQRQAETGFRHNTIVSNDDTLFLIDGLSANALSHLARRGQEPAEMSKLLALDLQTGEERWRTDSEVFGTFLMYSVEHDILIEGGSQDLRRRLGDEPRQIQTRDAADGTVLWTGGRFVLPAALLGDKLIPGRPGRAISVLTGEIWPREQPLTGTAEDWSYSRRYGCNTLNANEHILMFRTGYAGFYDLEHNTGTGNFSGFRSGCTANMFAADGVLNALDYTRTCTCSYGLQTSLAMIHMPGDPNLEFWTRYDAARPDPRGHGVNFGAPGRRVDVGGSGLIWHYRDGSLRRHPSAIRDNNGSLDWVLASAREVAADDAIRIDDIMTGTYTLRLHFAELDPRVEPGQRVFDVLVDGETVWRDIDIVNGASAAFRGMIMETEVEAGRRLQIELRRGRDADRKPLVNGIELIRH